MSNRREKLSVSPKGDKVTRSESGKGDNHFFSSESEEKGENLAQRTLLAYHKKIEFMHGRSKNFLAG
jgi:hypothetical protein